MSPQRIVGIVLLIVGAATWIVGISASDSVADRWSNFFTGHFTDATTWYILGGIAMSIVGAVMLFVGGSRRSA